MHSITRILLAILACTVFYFVLTEIEPPQSWPQASTFQILIFFLPLLATTTFSINLLLHNILRSFVMSLGILFALVLLAIKQLTPLTTAITFFVTGIIFVYTPTIRYFHTRELRKITHLTKNQHLKNGENHSKIVKKL